MSKNTRVKEAFKWVSRAVRLEEAIDYCRKNGIDLRQFVRPEDVWGQCICCKRVNSWIKMDCGHWIDRGSGGFSGVYFNRANLHLECKSCNAGFYRGTVRLPVAELYDDYMLQRYGEKKMDELRVLDKVNSYHGKVVMIGMAAKIKYKELCGELRK